MPLEKGRRSSILKPPKVRQPFSDLDLRPTEGDEDGTTMDTMRSRRVSFSAKKGVALFTSEDGNTIWHNIYEEANKPDLSDSGAGSNIHISMDSMKNSCHSAENQPGNSSHEGSFSVSNHDVTFANFPPHEDDDTEDHCVNIQAMLTGFNKPIDKEPPNINLEFTQPSFSDHTDMLINYKIPDNHSSKNISALINEDLKSIKYDNEKINAGGSVDNPKNIIFNGSQAEMSITQEISQTIHQINDPVKHNKFKMEFNLDTSISEVHKWVDNKDNILLREYYGDESQNDIIVKNESIEISFENIPASKRPSSSNSISKDFCDLPDKKIKCESDLESDRRKTINFDHGSSSCDMSMTAVIHKDIGITDTDNCNISMKYCFTKETKMNDRRDTIGFNQNLHNDMTCADSDDIDPLNVGNDMECDMSMTRVVTPSSCRFSKKFNNSEFDLDNLNRSDCADIKDFEFVGCNSEYSMKREESERSVYKKENITATSDIFSQVDNLNNLDSSDILRNIKSDLSLHSNERKYDLNDQKGNILMANIVSNENVKHDSDHIDRKVFDQSISIDDPIPNVSYRKSSIEKQEIKCLQYEGNKRKIVLFDPMPECDISAIEIVSDKNEKGKISGQKRAENISSMTNNVSKKLVDASKTIVFDSQKEECNMSKIKLVSRGNQEYLSNFDRNKRNTIMFDSKMPENDISIITTISNNDNSRRKPILFNPETPDCKMSITQVVSREKELSSNENEKRKTIVYNPACHMSAVIPSINTNKRNKDSVELPNKPGNKNEENRKTIVYNPACHMSAVIPSINTNKRNKDNVELPNKPGNKNEENRKTIVFNPETSGCNLLITTSIPSIDPVKSKTIIFDSKMTDFNTSATREKDKNLHIAENITKRQTIVSDSEPSGCNMSMTDVKTFVFDSQIPSSDMSITEAISREKENSPKLVSNRKKTILFDPELNECNMSMTAVIHKNDFDNYTILTSDSKVSEMNKSIVSQFSKNDNLNQLSGENYCLTKNNENKRKITLFNPEITECNMSMTAVIPNYINKRQILTPESKITEAVSCDKEGVFTKASENERRTVVFDSLDPECDMSMTSVIPSRTNKRQTIVFDTDMPESNMSVTEAISNIQDEFEKATENKRRTIVFDPETPECNMSMTAVIPNQKNKRQTIVFDTNMPESNMSVTESLSNKQEALEKATENKRRTIVFDPETPECNMSMTAVIPNQKNKRQTIVFDTNMPESNMSVTESLSNKQEALEKATENKRRIIVFDPETPECNMSMTAVIPNQKNKRQTIVFDTNMPESNMSVTESLSNKQEALEKATENKRRTIVFDPEIPECNMSMTAVIPNQKNKRQTIVFDTNMPESNMSVTESLSNKQEALEKATENKRRTIVFDPETPECNMSMTAVIPNQKNKRQTIVFDTNMPESNMSVTESLSNKQEALEKATENKRRTIVFDPETPECNMSMTAVIPNQKNKRQTIVFDTNMPESNMSVTESLSNKQEALEKATENKRRTIVFDPETPECNMSMTAVIPNQKNKRQTIVFDTNMPESNMSVTESLSNKQEALEKAIENKRRTIVFDPETPECNMSMTAVIPNQKNKRQTIVFDTNMPESNMSVTESLSNKQEALEKAIENKRRTIVFDPETPECNMFMTAVIPNQKNKRQTIVFDTNMPESNMSVTESLSNKQEALEKAIENKRRTIVFDPETPECNMSMTAVIPNQKNKRQTIVFDTNMPESNMSVTESLSNKQEALEKAIENKRRTIVFDPETPECNMSMTAVIPNQKNKRQTIVFDTNMPESNMSVTEAISNEENVLENASENKKRIILFDSKCDINIPSSDINTYIKKTIVFDPMPLCDVSMTEINQHEKETLAIERKNILFDSEMPECNKSTTPVIPDQEIEKETTSTFNQMRKRKTDIFDEVKLDFIISKPNIIYSDNVGAKTSTREDNENLHLNRSSKVESQANLKNCDNLPILSMKESSKSDFREFDDKSATVDTSENVSKTIRNKNISNTSGVNSLEMTSPNAEKYVKNATPLINKYTSDVFPSNDIEKEKNNIKHVESVLTPDNTNYQMAKNSTETDLNISNVKTGISYAQILQENNTSTTNIIQEKRKTLLFVEDKKSLNYIDNLNEIKSGIDFSENKENVVSNFDLSVKRTPDFIMTENVEEDLIVDTSRKGMTTNTLSKECDLKDLKANKSGTIDHKVLGASVRCNISIGENITNECSSYPSTVSAVEEEIALKKDIGEISQAERISDIIDDKKLPLITITEKFDEKDKILMNNTKLFEGSMSVTELIHRKANQSNSNTTSNSFSVYVPNIANETKSILADNKILHKSTQDILEIGSNFVTYRDINNKDNISFLSADNKSSMDLSLPDIDDSRINGFSLKLDATNNLNNRQSLVNKSLHGKTNIASTSFVPYAPNLTKNGDSVLLDDKMNEKPDIVTSCGNQISLKGNTFVVGMPGSQSFYNLTIPKIDETLPNQTLRTHNTLTQHNSHMSINSENIIEPVSDNLVNKSYLIEAKNVLSEISSKLQNNNQEDIEMEVEDCNMSVDCGDQINEPKICIDSPEHCEKIILEQHSFKINNKSFADSQLNVIKIDPVTLDIPDSKFDSENRRMSSNHFKTKLDDSISSLPQCQNEVLKKNLSLIEEGAERLQKSGEMAMLQMSDIVIGEKRKSDHENIDSSNFSSTKKQKVLPEVCSWIQEIVSEPNDKKSMESKVMADDSSQKQTDKFEIDTMTYTITKNCEYLLQDVTRTIEKDVTGTIEKDVTRTIEKASDCDNHLNNSDHLIANISDMSLVNSSLDKTDPIEHEKINMEYKKDLENKIIQNEVAKEMITNSKEQKTINEDGKEMEFSVIKEISEISDVQSIQQSECKQLTRDNDQKLGNSVDQRHPNISLCESVRTSVESQDSPAKPFENCNIKPVENTLEEDLQVLIEGINLNSNICVLEKICVQECRFTLMRQRIQLKVVFEPSHQRVKASMLPISDIILESLVGDPTSAIEKFYSIAIRIALNELDTRSLMSSCHFSGDISQLIARCCQVVADVSDWAKECYPLYVKYNLQLVEDRKWIFEICSAKLLCIWEVQIKLHNRRNIHYVKPENVRVNTIAGTSPIKGDLFKSVIEQVQPGWRFIPDIVIEVHNLVESYVQS